MKKTVFLLFFLLSNLIYSQDAWVQINDFPLETTTRTSYATDTNGFILLWNNDISTVQFYKYDPILDNYEQLADFPVQDNSYFTSFVVNNEGYVLLRDWNTPDSVVLLYKYNESQNTWEQKASTTFDFNGFSGFLGTAFSINDKGYLATSGGGGGSANFKEYDPVNDSWTVKPNYLGPSEGGSLDFTIGDIGYLVFGNDDFNYYPILWSYNQNTETWTQLEDIPWGGGSNADASFAIGEYGYVGLNPNVGSNVFYRYLPSSNTWEQIENCGYWARGSFSFSINNIGYVGAGYSFVYEKQVWSLDPELLSINNNENIDTIIVYPNPVNDFLNIQSLHPNLKFTVFDINGKQIFNGTLISNQISVSHLKSGTYIIKLIDDNIVSYIFFIKE